MSKTEVCAYLGKSKRTIESYVASGRLPAKYVNGPNGKTASFDPADVEAVKAAQGEVWDSSAKPSPSAGIALVPAVVTEFKPLIERMVRLAEFAQKLNAEHAKTVYVNLKDACALTGLSAATIKAAGVKTMPFGQGLRYRRADLEAL
jgi:predicted DNA-binding transcriptional regulator AlpA